METRDLEALKATINQSDAVLKEARAPREQLKERELKVKKQLKREAEAARMREAREGRRSARHTLLALLDASGRDRVTRCVRRWRGQRHLWRTLASYTLRRDVVEGNKRLQELDQKLAGANRVRVQSDPSQSSERTESQRKPRSTRCDSRCATLLRSARLCVRQSCMRDLT